MTKYSDLLADWLVSLGYTHCFFVAGGNIMHLLESCSHKLTCIPVVHEVAAGMKRHPDLNVASGREFELFRQNADYCYGVGIKPDGTSHNLWIPSKPRLPEIMVENGDVGTRSHIFARTEVASERWFDPERRKEIDCGLHSEYTLRLTRATEGETISAETGERLEGFRLRPPVKVIRI